MKFENNFWIGILFIAAGVFVLINERYYTIHWSSNGPKIIFPFVFVILGGIILRNWIKKN